MCESQGLGDLIFVDHFRMPYIIFYFWIFIFYSSYIIPKRIKILITVNILYECLFLNYVLYILIPLCFQNV